jgi:hypothetical protein
MKKYLSALLLVVLAVGCDDPASKDGSKADSDSKKPRNAGQDASSSDGKEPGGEVQTDGGRSPGKATADGSTQPNTPTQPNPSTGGGKDGGVPPTQTGAKDGGVPPTGAPDGGLQPPTTTDGGGVVTGSGSCCAEHETGGCGNADLMVCVCEKDPSCCTKAWGRQCVFIVEQKYCQAGIRDCVCGSAEGQWGQTQCCESEWSSTCDSVAKVKCDAVPGCF